MRIFILTGAGVSAESGLGTFRDEDGLWTKYDLSEVATPEGFAHDPGKVHDFYNARRKNAAAAYMLIRLASSMRGFGNASRTGMSSKQRLMMNSSTSLRAALT